jgi:branched-chain amino acid transport system substrate-binding protein
VKKYHDFSRVRIGFALAALIGLTVLAGCGSSSKSSSSSTASSSSTSSTSSAGATAGTSSCGTKPGVKASGTPINLGTINTKQPGTDFTDIPNYEIAYFNCVNDNGGINGHPIQLSVETDQTNPAQVAAAASKLIGTDHVVGIVGVTDLLECTIDHAYWQKLGVYTINSGIAPECWSTPNSAAVNMGPRYSSDGAVQYALGHGATKIVFDQSNVPGTGYIAGGPAAIAGAAHVPITQLTENVPVTDASSVALKEVQDAGHNGAVILNFTPPEALVILQAAQKLGIEGNVKSWGCSTPCNTDFLAKALGPKWNNKLFVNAELTPPDNNNTPEFQLYRAILSKYGSAVSGGIGSFSQFGFVEAAFAVKALETIKGPYTVQSVNQAFLNIKNYKTAMLCQPWTYGKVALHIPNNADFTTTPSNGQMLVAQGCTNISSADPQIAQYRSAATKAGL